MQKTRIPLNALCGQDFHVFRWPRKSDDPETWFMAEKVSEGWCKGSFVLTAPGYGEKGNYGNGKIYVRFAHFKDCSHLYTK